MSLAAQIDFFSAALQVFPGGKPRFFRTAFGTRLVAAKKDMAPFLSDFQL